MPKRCAKKSQDNFLVCVKTHLCSIQTSPGPNSARIDGSPFRHFPLMVPFSSFSHFWLFLCASSSSVYGGASLSWALGWVDLPPTYAHLRLHWMGSMGVGGHARVHCCLAWASMFMCAKIGQRCFAFPIPVGRDAPSSAVARPVGDAGP